MAVLATAAVIGSTVAAPAVAAPAPTPAPGTREAAGIAQKYQCRSFGSFPAYNSKADVERGFFSWPKGRKAKVGNGTNINWKSNPYKDDSWRTWFHSLAWIGSLVDSSTRGITKNRDPKAIEAATAIAYDWVRDNKAPWPTGPGAGNATHTRVDSLTCLRAGLIQLGKPVPKWLDQSLIQHADWLKRNTWKDHNVGTEQTLAVMGVGCMTGRKDLTTYAVGKFSKDIGRVIDKQGANNEQSTGYARWNWKIWGDVNAAMDTCGVSSPAQRSIKNRTALLATFLDHATKPDGYLVQIGDTKRERAETGTPAQQWIASNGKVGAPPKERVKVYNAGYALGRSGWGTPAGQPGRLPSQESMYAIHYGPVRLGHGHNDHMSFTWNSLGREILGDPGAGQYTNDAWRDFYTGPSGHNQLVIPRMKTSQVTTLAKSRVKAGADYYRLTDKPLKEATRQRDVLFLSDPDIAITVDSATSTLATSFAQTWHLPAGQNAKLVGGTMTATAPKVAGKTTMLSLPAPGATSTRNALVKGSTKPIQGWMWKDHFAKSAAPVVTRTASGKKARIATAFVSSGSRDRVAVTAKQSGRSIVYTFTVGSRTARVSLAADGTLTRVA